MPRVLIRVARSLGAKLSSACRRSAALIVEFGRSLGMGFVQRMAFGVLIAVVFWLTVRPPSPDLRTVQLCLVALALAGLALGVGFPRTGSIVSALATGLAWFLGLSVDPFLLSSMSLFSYAERHGTRQLPHFLLVLVPVFFLFLMAVGFDEVEDVLRNAILSIVALVGAWVLGVRTRRGREEAMERAQAEERVRLSGEVHDVLSYSLGTIGVRAGVAAHVENVDESALKNLLRDIEQSAASGVRQLRGLLDKERQGAAPSQKSRAQEKPWSLSSELRSIVQTCEQANIATKIRLQGALDGLPNKIRTTVLRIVQEAAANVVIHAHASELSIRVQRGADAVQIEVLDNGCGSMESLRPGHGLNILRERARLLDGTVEMRDRPDGGLALVASIPCDPLVPGEV